MKRRNNRDSESNMTQLQLARRDKQRHESRQKWLAAIDECVEFLVNQCLKEHVLQYQHVGSEEEFNRIHRGVMGRLIRHAIAMKAKGEPRWYDDSETDAEKRLLYILPQWPFKAAPAKPKPKVRKVDLGKANVIATPQKPKAKTVKVKVA